MPGRFFLYPDDPVVFVQGRGTTLVDSEGREYLDVFSGHAVTSYGHCHPKIVEAIQDQAAKLIHYPPDTYTVPMTMLAEKLATINKLGLTKTFFLSSGTEAVECALFLSRKYTHRQDIIALHGAFHGRGYGARSATGWYGYKRGMGPYLPGVTHIPSYYCYRCAFGLEYPDCSLACAKFLEQAIKYQTTGDVAAFIAEPIQGTAGNIVPPDDYFKTVRQILDEHNILLIADEVITGFGRTGKLFAVEHYGVSPDIMTVAKAIAAGVPAAATMATDRVASAFQEGDYFTTFGGNPIACAAGLAALEVLEEEKLIERAEELGTYALKLFKGMIPRHELIGDVRGKGLLIGIELVKDRKTKEPARQESMKIRYEAKKRGLVLASGMGWLGNCMRINPPLIITREEIEKAAGIIEESISAVEKNL
jgi:4-aminobutyrate aminotransferase